jgi:hypothetical protein
MFVSQGKTLGGHSEKTGPYKSKRDRRRNQTYQYCEINFCCSSHRFLVFYGSPAHYLKGKIKANLKIST